MIKRFIKFKLNYKMDEQKTINFCKIANYSTKGSSNKMQTANNENGKKKLALISAKMNFGQVLLILTYFFRKHPENNQLEKKGKRGTELGPNNIKQDFLFTNLENLSKSVIPV
jgi:hypothetical protein